MNTNQQSRLEKLEAQIKVQRRAGIWVDMFDNTVRVDINHNRGEVLTFDSVSDCAAWVESRMQESENVTGMAFISDIASLGCFEGAPSETLTAWESVPIKGVLINLSGHGRDSLSDVALVSWMHSMTGIANRDTLENLFQTLLV